MNKFSVRLKSGTIVNDETFHTEKEIRAFCDKYGYMLISFEYNNK